MLDEFIEQRVDEAMKHTFRLEIASGDGVPISQDKRRENLVVLFREIALGVGIENFLQIPLERLDQFAVMSLVKNHDTQGLIRSLVNSFMIAYSTPETSEVAFKTLVVLEELRERIAVAKGQKPAGAVH